MVTDDFNPYHEWLGLDAQLKQPNYYQLLGVDQSEADAQKIAAAADRALSKVRSVRPGPRAAEWAKLLDEMAAARFCLTDPAKRAEYDRQLASSQFSAPTSYRRPTPRDKASPNVDVPMSPNANSTAAVPMAAPVQSPATMMPGGPAAAPIPTAGQPAGPVAEPQMPMQAPAPHGGATAYASPTTPYGHMPQAPAGPVAGSPGAPVAGVAPAVGAPMATPQGYPAGSPQPMPTGPMQGIPPAGAPSGVAPGTPVYGTPTGYPASSPQPTPIAAQPARNIPTGVPVGATTAGAIPAASTRSSPGVQVGQKKSASVMARRRSDRSKMVPYLAAGIGFLILFVAIALLAVVGGNGSKDGKSSRRTTSKRPAPRTPTPAQPFSRPSRSVRDRTPRSGPSAVREYKREPAAGERADRPPEPSTMEPPPEVNVEPGTRLMGSSIVDPQPDPTGTTDRLSQPKPTPAEPALQPEATPGPDAKLTQEPPASPAESKGTQPEAKVVPKPDPAARSKPEPTPAPAAKSKREDVEALSSALKAARAALEDYDFDGAVEGLKKVRPVPKLPEHQAKFERLDLLAQYAQQFRSALLEAINSLEAGSEIKIGTDEIIVVVSATPQRLTVRVRGTSRTFAINDLPPGLAVAVADSWLDQGDSVTPVLKAAYVASLKDAKEDQLAKAREWFREGAKRGADIGDLATVIDDTYELAKGLAQ